MNPSSPSNEYQVINTSALGLECTPDSHEEKINSNQTLLAQDQNETLSQIDEKFKGSYFLYKCWLYFMFANSAFTLPNAFILALNSVIHNGGFIRNKENLAIFVFGVLLFAQFLLEILAIWNRDLSKATLALGIMSFNTLAYLGITGYFAYCIQRFDIDHPKMTEDRGLAQIFLQLTFIIMLVLLITQILFTLLPAIKVRKNLIHRENFRASHEVSLPK